MRLNTKLKMGKIFQTNAENERMVSVCIVFAYVDRLRLSDRSWLRRLISNHMLCLEHWMSMEKGIS